jgi:[acyl-carrier-protein] S-malonyltransferase
MSVAFLFPGQGSQSVGMLADLAARHSQVRETFATASAVLGFDLWVLCQEGPAERLNATEYTQPAMLAAAVATWRIWTARGGAVPALVSGHSLGEFTALVCAEALDFEAAIDLVRFRGQLMQSAVPSGAGAMAAVLGLEDTEIERACREAAQGEVVEPANYNAPGQVVIGGQARAVERAIAAAKALGAKRAVLLPMSVPPHTSLMRPTEAPLRERLVRTTIRSPRIPYFSGVDAARHDDPDDIRANLVRQLATPVRWTATVRALLAAGATRLIECGPGKVLTALSRRADKRTDVEYLALEDCASLDAALASGRGG